MTVALLELALSGAFLYAGIKCVQLLPLLAGRDEPSTHCTGSIVALIAAYLADRAGSGILSKILAGIAGGAAGAAAKKIFGGGGGSTEEPTPVEPSTPPPEIPPVIPDAFVTPLPGAAPLGATGQSAHILQTVV